MAPRIFPIQDAELQAGKFCWLMPSFLQLGWFCALGMCVWTFAHALAGLIAHFLSCLAPLSNLLQSHPGSTPATFSLGWQWLQKDGTDSIAANSMNRHRWGQMISHLVNKNPLNNILDCRTAAEQWWGEVLLKLFTQLDAKPCTPQPCSQSPAEKISRSAPDWNEHWIECWGMLCVLPLCFNWQCHLQHWLTGSSLDPKWCCPWCLMVSLCLFFCLSNIFFYSFTQPILFTSCLLQEYRFWSNFCGAFWLLWFLWKSILPSQHPVLSPKTSLLDSLQVQKLLFSSNWARTDL